MLAWLPLAHAQGNDQPVAASNGLEEIVVTARRREEKLQTVSISVQAFSGETLQKHRVEGIQDLSKLVPALTNVETKRDEEGLSIRGLNNSGASAQGQSNSVTTYFAEVPLPTGDSMGSGRYYDLDDAQVLKGPQGTLFGRNSTGGALLIGPKRPTNNFEGYAEVQFGNYGDREYQFAVNIPIVDDVLLARFAGERVRRDGFTHDVMTGQDLDSRDSWSGRGSITFRPADSFENYFVYDTYYSHSTGTSEILAYANPNFVITSLGLIPGCNTPVTLGGAGVLGGFNYGASFCSGVLPRVALFPGSVVDDAVAQQKALGIRANNGSVNGLDVSVSSGATDIATWSIDDNLTLKNIFGYREYKVLNRADGDGSALKLLDFPTPGGWNTTTAQYSEELQLQGKSLDDRLVWTVGNFALYSHAAGNENSTTVAVGSTTYTNLRPTERSEALFTQATYDLGGITPMLDGLRFTGGFRYTWDFRRLFQNQYNARGCVLGTSANGCTINLASEFHAPTWNVGLDYQLGSDTLLYATGRRGYRSGGLNTQSGGAVSPEFQPETVTDVEIGVKSDWRIMGMQARTNLSAFHSDFSNAQLSESGTLIGPTGAAQAVNAIVNAASATIQGIDLDATLIPVTGLKLTASWAYTQAKYDSVVNFFDPNDQATKRRPYPFTPLNKLVLDANYTLPLPQEWGPISVDVTWSYSTHQALAVLVDPMGNQSAYRTLDLHLAWDDIFGQPIDAQFFMTNVTDNEYRIGGFPVGTSLGFDAFVWNEPQMFGFSLKYRFGGPAETEAAPAAYAPPPTQAPAPAPRSYLVFFDFNKSDLSPQAKDIVDTAAKNASANKVTQLTVTGHTDTVGSDAYNMRLSRRRAEAVAAQLEKDGVPSSEIAIVAKGKRDLLVPTADGVREPQNRRVQIVFDGAAGS